MRWIAMMASALILVAMAAGGIRADEDPVEPIIEDVIIEDVIIEEVEDLQAARIQVLNQALEALRMRMEARIQTAEILRELDRLEEALAVYRQVDEVWTEGLERVEALLAKAEGRAKPPAVIPDAPFEGPRPKVAVGMRPGAVGKGVRGESRRPVEDALKWLAAHQAPSGAWEAATHNRWCDGKPAAQGPDGVGKNVYDPGVTGLALLAFLGAGYTNRGNHEYATVVSRGLRYLKNVQDPEGCFGPRTSQHFIYNHGTAALAMIEAYGLTGSPIFRASAQAALDFIAMARNPYFAWRYGVKPGDNDTSVTGWMLASIKSAKVINGAAKAKGEPAPLVIDEACFDGVKAWLDKMTDPDYGRVGYIQRGGSPARPQALIDKFPGDKSEAMTAEGMLMRIWIGENPRKSAILKKGAKLLDAIRPKWDPDGGTIDMYYWYFGTKAMYHVGGAEWRRWHGALKRAVVDSQRKDTTHCMYLGSWDPIGPWGGDGGRVYSTALMAMTLQVYYRHKTIKGFGR